MDIYTFLIQLLNGVQYGLLLFLVASGLTLIFGIMGIINLAHGSFYMVGAYMAFTLSSLTGNLFVAIVVGIVLSVLLGIVLEWALISHLYKRDHLEQVLLTYGLILVFEELRSLIVGNDVHGVAVPAILNGSIPLTATLSYPGVPAVHVGGLPRARGLALPADPPHARRHDDPRRRVEPRDGVGARAQHQPRLPAGVRAGRRARGVRRDDRGAGVVGLPGHGHAGADHLLRRRRDRRHRLDLGRAVRRVADRPRRHLRQGAASPRPRVSPSIC